VIVVVIACKNYILMDLQQQKLHTIGLHINGSAVYMIGQSEIF